MVDGPARPALFNPRQYLGSTVTRSQQPSQVDVCREETGQAIVLSGSKSQTYVVSSHVVSSHEDLMVS